LIEELNGIGWLQGETLSQEKVLAVREEVESEIDPEAQGVAFRNLAKVFHWAGKYDEAAPRARDAIRLLPQDLESRYVLADCLKQTGRPRDALAQYQDLFQIGDFSRAYLPYGELLCEQGELLEAKSFLMRAILSDRDDHRARAHYDLGLVHLQLGEFEFAIESLRESDRLYPNDPATLALIAEAELGRGQWKAAVKELTRVTTLAPGNFYSYYRLAELFSENGHQQEASFYIKNALRLEPENQEAVALETKIRQQLQKEAD
jgi:tetratricopeptide (TPR) repeat protein